MFSVPNQDALGDAYTRSHVVLSVTVFPFITFSVMNLTSEHKLLHYLPVSYFELAHSPADSPMCCLWYGIPPLWYSRLLHRKQPFPLRSFSVLLAPREIRFWAWGRDLWVFVVVRCVCYFSVGPGPQTSTLRLIWVWAERGYCNKSQHTLPLHPPARAWGQGE